MPTRQLTPLSVRPFTADDYSIIAQLHNANFPEYAMDGDEWRFHDDHRPMHCRSARWLAESGGRVVGFAEYDQHPGFYDPRRYMLQLVVDPGWLGRGIGARLYAVVLGELLALGALAVDAWSREDMPGRIEFFTRRGFVGDMRLWTSELDLTRFDGARFADIEPTLEAQGIQIRTLAELGQHDAEVQRKVFDMWLEVRRDIPHPPGEEPVDVPFEAFWERQVRPQLLPKAYFLAVEGERYVGTSQLWSTAEPGVLRTGLTGVRLAYRRRGIAFALKARSLALAQVQGYTSVLTENESGNRGMLAINDQLGFVRNPAWVHYSKSIRP